MREDKLLSSLMPSHPDLLPVIQDIREKFDLPEVGREDDGLTEILLSNMTLDWEEINLSRGARPCAPTLPTDN